MAAKQATGHNTSMFPKNDVIAQRDLIDQQTKILALYRLLCAEDMKDEKESQERLTTYVFDPERLIRSSTMAQSHCQHCHSCNPNENTNPTLASSLDWDRKDQIQEALSTRLERYCKNVTPT